VHDKKVPARDQDPREAPAYGIAEAAHYLGIPRATLRAWALGQCSSLDGERRLFKAVLRIADREHRLLSFYNLVEAHILDALRREHGLSLQKLRKALDFLARRMPSEHPLAWKRFATDGLHLFVEEVGRLTDVTQEGQMALLRILEAYLSRIEWDPQGRARQFYPFVRRRDRDDPKVVVIDPAVSFGRPALAGTGIPTSVICERFKAGETFEELAHDYGREPGEIQEAIRCELRAA
jgi:uncharacterized protein (DUF433 family)